MQVARPQGVQARINVTPLVDVVLVLLIIFMIIAPQLQTDVKVDLPTTDRPQDKPDDGKRISVVVEADGSLWIDGEPTAAEAFERRVAELALTRADAAVVIQGDAHLTFGTVQRTMLAVEAAGFDRVALIAARRDTSSDGG